MIRRDTFEIVDGMRPAAREFVALMDALARSEQWIPRSVKPAGTAAPGAIAPVNAAGRSPDGVGAQIVRTCDYCTEAMCAHWGPGGRVQKLFSQGRQSFYYGPRTVAHRRSRSPAFNSADCCEMLLAGLLRAPAA